MTSAIRRGVRFAWVPVLCLAGCRPAQPDVTHLRGQAMGTSYSIKYVPRNVRDSVGQRIEAELAAFNRVFSTYDPESEISRFNRHASTDPFAVSAGFLAVVQRALQLAASSSGACDPTVGPVLRLYGFGPGAKPPAVPPSAVALRSALDRCGWARLEVRGDSLVKQIPELELDLNSVAKGTGVDVVAGVLDGFGILSYMVEIGGEVRCRGRKPDGRLWRLGVAKPEAPHAPVDFAAKVDLKDQAMATSGSYLQYRRIDAAKIHHIIDPRTGENPDVSVVSVTVVAPTCERADGLATALMVLGPKAGDAMLGRLPDREELRVLYQLLDAGGDVVEHRYRW